MILMYLTSFFSNLYGSDSNDLFSNDFAFVVFCSFLAQLHPKILFVKFSP